MAKRLGALSDTKNKDESFKNSRLLKRWGIVVFDFYKLEINFSKRNRCEKMLAENYTTAGLFRRQHSGGRNSDVLL
ncbi:MAG: hypothetical protein IH859_07915 [Chloroflexi bacterium]|nr:hypothetical protein [Chloroflexota bacterium]